MNPKFGPTHVKSLILAARSRDFALQARAIIATTVLVAATHVEVKGAKRTEARGASRPYRAKDTDMTSTQRPLSIVNGSYQVVIPNGLTNIHVLMVPLHRSYSFGTVYRMRIIGSSLEKIRTYTSV